MTGFEHGSSGIRSDHAVNCATPPPFLSFLPHYLLPLILYLSSVTFLKMGCQSRHLFRLFSFVSNNILQYFSGVRTQIVRIGGEHADHTHLCYFFTSVQFHCIAKTFNYKIGRHLFPIESHFL